MGRPNRYSPEVRERAVRLVLEHEREHDSQWAAIRSIAAEQAGPHVAHWVANYEPLEYSETK